MNAKTAKIACYSDEIASLGKISVWFIKFLLIQRNIHISVPRRSTQAIKKYITIMNV